jgi:hypothetical protein
MGQIPVELYDLARQVNDLVHEIFPIEFAQEFLTEPCEGMLTYRVHTAAVVQIFISCHAQNWFIDVIMFHSYPRKKETGSVQTPKDKVDLADLKKILSDLYEILSRI